MKTYGELLAKHSVKIPAHLIEQAEVPVLTGPQRQGDLMVVPIAAATWRHLTVRPVGAGVQVVHGEATGNTHWLHGDQAVLWARVDSGQVVGVVEVPAGSVAHLVHTDEHGANGIGPGLYRINRKREQSVTYTNRPRIVRD